ncbi:MAG: hypothetical protein R2880_00270 [Deinococcales bacterium]
METAKLLIEDEIQGLILPEEFHFNTAEIFVQKYGEILLLMPKEKRWQVFLEGLDGFSDDFMTERE